jgi:hypothetical protein
VLTEKYFSLERILGSINNEKDLEGQTSPKERDYIIESMIDDPKSNPVQVRFMRNANFPAN